MVSVTSTKRIVVATALGATLGLAGSLPSVADAPRAPAVRHVDPAALRTGVRPTIPYLELAQQRIVQPGRPAISVKKLRGPRGLHPTDLLHTGDGYLTTVHLLNARSQPAGFRVVHVSKSGRSRVVVRSSAFRPILVSAGGGWAVLRTNDPRRTTLRVVRISDGRVVGTRAFARGANVRPAAAGSGRVLLQRNTRSKKGYYSDTLWWTPATNAVKVLDRRHSTSWAARELAPAASLGARSFVVGSGNREVVLDLRTKHRLWRTGSHEYVLSYSPDDARVVTASRLQDFDQEAPWGFLAKTLRVRDARSGRILTTLTGRFAVLDPGIFPVWETSRRLLLHATGPFVADPDPDSEGSYRSSSIVRCTTAGACVRVPVKQWSNVDLLVRKSN